MQSLVEKLKFGDKKIGIWGLGYIGISSMAYFARAGIKCIGYDVIKDKVDAINIGNISIPNYNFWLGFDIKPFVEQKLMQATYEWQDLISNECLVHLICVATEKGAEPFDDYLLDVIEKICTYKKIKTDMPPLIVIESTITPNRVEEKILPLISQHGLNVGNDLLLGVAPRRDWFTEPDKNLKTLPRVIGGTTQQTTDLMAEVFGLICDKIYKATDHKHAALVKSIENAYRHVEIALANQLSLAYPNVNMTEVLRLVGTKWNIGTYHPSFGTGGYCIPLAPQYVLLGADNKDALSILKTAIEFDNQQPYKVVESLVRKDAKKVAILGLAYKGDLKVDTLSPTIKIVEALKKYGINVKVHDPYYSEKEIYDKLAVETFKFPKDLKEFDTVLINTDHMLYKALPIKEILENTKNCKLILDNTGVWKNIPFKDIEYHEAGNAKWL